MRKLRAFARMGGPERRFVCEAVFLLGVARLAVLGVPFRRLAPWLDRAPERGAVDPTLLAAVRRAVTTAARHVPWEAACLPQAIAAKLMLARRGCGSSLHLGAAFDRERGITAHAWLVVAGTVVVGGGASRRAVSPIARFG